MSSDEILIAGAGPTGLTLACELLRHGVGCRVVDAAPHAADRSRAIGVSPRSLEILDELGAAEELVSRGLPSPLASLYSNGRRVARFGSSRIRHTRFPFVLAVPQSDTEAVLGRAFKRLGGHVERGVTVRDVRDRSDSLAVTLDAGGEAAEHVVRWVVGADGAHSTVRRTMGVPFTGRATGHVFVNVDAALDGGPAPGEGHYYFSPAGLLVIAPLPDGIYRVTALVDAASADGALTLADIQRLIDERCSPGIRARSMRDAGWGIARFAVHARIADRFVLGRRIIAGDAAHIYGPVGAQGMNAGIQDAHNLAWKLALAATGRASERLVDTYDRERRAISHEVLHAVEAQARAATIKSRTGGRSRDALLLVASRAGLLDRAIVPRISQLDVRYAPDALADGAQPRGGARGRRMPDLPLRASGGAPVRLYELLGRRPFTALALDLDPGPAFDELRTALAERDTELLAIRSLDTPAEDHLDVGGELPGILRREAPALCLLRPDAHVAYVGSGDDRAALVAALDRLLARNGYSPAAT